MKIFVVVRYNNEQFTHKPPMSILSVHTTVEAAMQAIHRDTDAWWAEVDHDDSEPDQYHLDSIVVEPPSYDIRIFNV